MRLVWWLGIGGNEGFRGRGSRGGLTTSKAGDMAADLSSRAVMQSGRKLGEKSGRERLPPTPPSDCGGQDQGEVEGAAAEPADLKPACTGEGRIDDDMGSSRNE